MIVVITTGDNREALQRLAESLVEQGLAACCQIDGPITSIYSWDGNVERSDEFRCFIKTTNERYSEVEAAIRAGHEYDQPQIIALPVTLADPGYRQWVRDNTQP